MQNHYKIRPSYTVMLTTSFGNPLFLYIPTVLEQALLSEKKTLKKSPVTWLLQLVPKPAIVVDQSETGPRMGVLFSNSYSESVRVLGKVYSQK